MKNYTKGAKRRAKRDMADFDVPDVPRKQPNGRTRRDKAELSDRNPQKVVLAARARHMGKTAKQLDEMRLAALGEPAGMAIYKTHTGDEAHRRWQAYAGFTAAEATYAKTYLGLRLHAKTAKVEYLIERFEARPDDSPDLRSEEERSRDAANNWARWRGYVGCLARPDQQAIYDVAYGRAEPMLGGKVGPYGKRFVEAVGRLADVVERGSK